MMGDRASIKMLVLTENWRQTLMMETVLVSETLVFN
jgi:hypothetical protein